MNKFIISLSVMALTFLSPAMAGPTDAYKTNKNMRKCEEKCEVLFKSDLITKLFSSTPTASKVTCVDFCMQKPSASTSQLPVADMKYHVLDTYFWGTAKGNPVVFQTQWNAFKAWMDKTYLAQCAGLKVVNRDFVRKVKKSYKRKDGQIFCFSDISQNYNKMTGTVGILK